MNNNNLALMEQVVTKGDLSQLNPQDRVMYYKAVCESVGLNPLTKPFEFMVLQGKTTLYARKDATDQLRKIHGISIKITSREKVDDVYLVTAMATDNSSRSDESIGAISLFGTTKDGKTYPLKGDALANAFMKCETKAKRRVTLSIAGLGLLDEHETDSIKDAHHVNFDVETGEIIEPKPKKETLVPTGEDLEVFNTLNKMHSENDMLGAHEILSKMTREQKMMLKKHCETNVLDWFIVIAQNPPKSEIIDNE